MSIGITQDNYPETLGKMFIINSGMLFSGVWTIFKHTMDTVTQKKIHIISGSGKKELLEIIEAKNLPKFLGGEASDDLQ